MKIRAALVFVLAFFSGGCVALNFNFLKEETAYNPLTEKTVPEFFNIKRPQLNIDFKDDVDGADKFISRSFEFKSWFTSEYERNNTIKGTLYIPNKKKASDIFIILPGSAEDMSAKLSAEALAEMGFYAVRIHSGFKPFPKELMNQALQMPDAQSLINFVTDFTKDAARQHIIDLMRLNDFLESSLKPRAFHAIGISLGGITGSLLAGIDPRVKALMMDVSSAHIARILMDSKIEDISLVRIQLLEKFKLSYDEAYLLLKEKLKLVEPTTYADRVDSRRVLMVSGLLDMVGFMFTAMPWSATRETWASYGYPQWIIFPFTDHITSFLSFFPFWVELPNIFHLPQTIIFDGSYARHLFKTYFLPMALR